MGGIEDDDATCRSVTAVYAVLYGVCQQYNVKF